MNKILVKKTEMEDLNGIVIKNSDIPYHNFYAHLVFFDGPLISLFKGDSDYDFIFQWVDSNNTYNRWCMIPVNKEDLNKYINTQISLKDLISLSNGVYYIDTITNNTDGTVDILNASVIFLNIPDIPINYLPDQDSFLIDDICTEEAFILKGKINQ